MAHDEWNSIPNYNPPYLQVDKRWPDDTRQSLAFIRIGNQTPKGNMWTAIPVALLCMIVNKSETEQGSSPRGGKVL